MTFFAGLPLPLHVVAIFLNAIALDIIWAFYIRRTGGEDASPDAAAFWASLTLLSGSFAGVSFVEHYWLVIPAMMGGYLGTRMTVAYDAAKTKREKAVPA